MIYSCCCAFTRIKIWFEHIIIYTYVHEVHLGWLSVRMLCLNTKCIKRTMLSRENQTRESDPSSTFPIKIHRNNRCFKSLKYFQALPRWFNNGQIKYSTLHCIALLSIAAKLFILLFMCAKFRSRDKIFSHIVSLQDHKFPSLLPIRIGQTQN